jgi:ABC-type dipeptide/oligopeptide/nickel transport system ATPase component
MAQLIGIIGSTGSGKSTSLSTLDPTSSYIINIASKRLPFKGSQSVYNVDKKNYCETDKWDMVVKLIDGVSKSRPDVKTIVIDDFNLLMSFEFMKRSKEAGYGKFADIGSHIGAIVETARNSRDDLNIYFMAHDENVIDGGAIVSRKIKTVGRMIV